VGGGRRGGRRPRGDALVTTFVPRPATAAPPADGGPGAPRACIVDALSTGAALGSALRDASWELVHVASGREVAGSLAASYRPDDFALSLGLRDQSLDEITAALRAFAPSVVVAGTESGTPLADELADRLGLPGNDPATSGQRRDKHAMARALAAAGLPHAREEHAVSPAHAVAAATSLGAWPVVVKPLDAAGSEDVRLCHSARAVAAAFTAIHDKRNLLGLRNRGALVQEFLTGEQFMVNAVSLGGEHRITEIWREQRLLVPGAGFVYDWEIMVPYEGEPQRALVAYLRRVLDALGVREGASHSELMVTARGPVLIECAARLQGGISSSAVTAAIGDSHVTTTMQRYADPAGFQADIGRGYEIRRTPMVVNLIAHRSGTVRENNCERLLRTLPSFHSVTRTPAAGDPVARTVDLLTKTGHIYLLHADVEQLHADYRQIREWERSDRLLPLR